MQVWEGGKETLPIKWRGETGIRPAPVKPRISHGLFDIMIESFLDSHESSAPGSTEPQCHCYNWEDTKAIDYGLKGAC